MCFVLTRFPTAEFFPVRSLLIRSMSQVAQQHFATLLSFDYSLPKQTQHAEAVVELRRASRFSLSERPHRGPGGSGTVRSDSERPTAPLAQNFCRVLQEVSEILSDSLLPLQLNRTVSGITAASESRWQAAHISLEASRWSVWSFTFARSSVNLIE